MGGSFHGVFQTEQLSKRNHRLLAPLVFIDPEHGRLVVPAGEDTDFASIRPVRSVAVALIALSLLLTLLPLEWLSQACGLFGLVALAIYASLAGYADKAGALHDYLYRQGLLSRRQCDDVLYRAARHGEGLARWRSALYWAGVRLGGTSRYKKS